jgi:hypothetical protein
MAFRGLITLRTLDRIDVPPVDFVVTLGDDFNKGEELVAMCRVCSTLEQAQEKITPHVRAVLHFKDDGDRDTWAREWAEKIWIITWHGYRAEVHEAARV